MFIPALFIISELRITKVYFRRLMDNVWYIQMMEYYSSLKRNKLSHEKTWKKLESIPLSDRSQSRKGTYCMTPTL